MRRRSKNEINDILNTQKRASRNEVPFLLYLELNVISLEVYHVSMDVYDTQKSIRNIFSYS